MSNKKTKKDVSYSKEWIAPVVIIVLILMVAFGWSWVVSQHMVEGMCKNQVKKNPAAKDYASCKKFNL